MSRNQREGHFVGFAAGKAVRRIKRLFPNRVKAVLARAFLRGRHARRSNVEQARLLDQQGAQ